MIRQFFRAECDDGHDLWQGPVVEYESSANQDYDYHRITMHHECYCCSCDDDDSYVLDPFCRNHGGAHGIRPCEVHGAPGSEICCLDDLIDGRMPESVQTFRNRHAQLPG